MRRIQFTCALLFALVLVAVAPRAYSQRLPPPPPPRKITMGQATGQPNASKQTTIKQSTPLVAEYDIGLIVKRLAALDAQVEALKQQNQSLAAQHAAQNKTFETKLAQVQAKLNQIEASTVGVKQAEAKIHGLDIKYKQLDASLQLFKASFTNHTHYMPDIGLTALSALPGMQDIANKAGMGHVKAQWDTIRMLWIPHPSNGIAITGVPYKQN